MKSERLHTALWGTGLGLCMGLGGIGCMVTGFGLALAYPGQLVLGCLLAAALSVLACRWKRGGLFTALSCLLALGLLWYKSALPQQLWQLVYRLSYVYDRAYHWGVFRLVDTPWNAGYADLPLGVLGGLISIQVSHSLCRGRGSAVSVFLGLIPLILCLVVTDTVPAVPFLLMLMATAAMLLLTSGVRQGSHTQANRLSAAIALPLLLVLGGLFLAVPQEGYVNQSKELQEAVLRFGEDLPRQARRFFSRLDAPAPGSDAQPDLNLKNVGARIRQTYPVMEVTSETGGLLYLRERDYDLYTGTGWSASEERKEAFGMGGGETDTVTIHTFSPKGLLYLPYYPREPVTLTGGALANTGQWAEFSLTRTLPGTAGAGAELSEDPWIDLPYDTWAMAQSILREFLPQGTRAEQAAAIAAYVRASANYDLGTRLMPEGEEDFALWFLRESDTGYCVHFATAAAVLLRAADIPARYVTGYMVHTQPGQTTTVTAGDAHAWAEYYDTELGAWVVLEATPPDPETLEASEPDPIPQPTYAPTEPQPSQPTAPPTEESLPPEATTLPEPLPVPEPEPPEESREFPVLIALLVVTAAVLLTLFQRIVRLKLRQRRCQAEDPNRQALALWQEVVLLTGLLKQEPPEELIRLAQKAKFSQHTLNREELGQFENCLRRCRRELKSQSWYKRLIHQYLYAAY